MISVCLCDYVCCAYTKAFHHICHFVDAVIQCDNQEVSGSEISVAVGFSSSIYALC